MAKQIVNGQLDRMKALMNYGLQTESKQAYSTVEYQKVGADGKTYGILREGTKFYIKVAPNKSNLIKEDFSYIGGFRNRKDNEYTSYANAQKQFDLKMRSLSEAYSNGKNIIIESWNPNKQQELSVEATDNMRREILRERQIMANAQSIMTEGSKKGQSTDSPYLDNDGKGKGSDANSKSPKSTAKNGTANVKDYNGKDIKCKGGDCFCEKPCTETIDESADVLGFSRDHDDYMDKSHGTKIGPSAPFDNAKEKNADAVADADGGEEISSQTGKVNEGKSMHDTDNQNSPTPGVGEIGDTAPFDGEKGRQIDEEKLNENPAAIMANTLAEVDDPEIDDTEMPEDGAEMPEDDMEDPLSDGSEEFDDSELDDELGDEDVDSDVYEDDVEDRLNNVEELLMQIADKLGISQNVDEEDYLEDDDLYGDDEEDEEPEYELDIDDEEDEMPEDDEFEDEEPQRFPESRFYKGARIFETRNYRRLMSEENRLNDFGKHPAYQKKVMTYPDPDMQEFPDYYDMNDDSVKGEKPYGLQIGDTAPFTITPESIDNSIAESVKRVVSEARKADKNKQLADLWGVDDASDIFNVDEFDKMFGKGSCKKEFGSPKSKKKSKN